MKILLTLFLLNNLNIKTSNNDAIINIDEKHPEAAAASRSNLPKAVIYSYNEHNGKSFSEMNNIPAEKRFRIHSLQYMDPNTVITVILDEYNRICMFVINGEKFQVLTNVLGIWRITFENGKIIEESCSIMFDGFKHQRMICRFEKNNIGELAMQGIALRGNILTLIHPKDNIIYESSQTTIYRQTISEEELEKFKQGLLEMKEKEKRKKIEEEEN